MTQQAGSACKATALHGGGEMAQQVGGRGVRDQKRQPLTRLILANAFIHKECILPYRYTAWRSEDMVREGIPYTHPLSLKSRPAIC